MKKTLLRLGALAVSACAVFGCAACKDADKPTVEEEEKVTLQAPAYEAADATLTVSGTPLQGADAAISKELFGVFLEDINYASQALDDNLVINGSFESKYQGQAAYGWEEDGATLRVENTDGVLGETYRDAKGNYVNPSYARVEAKKAGDAVANRGYVPVPIAVEKGRDYLFSAFMKAEKDVAVTVDVVGGETVYATETIDVKSGGWVKYRRTLTATESAEKNLKLRLSFGGAAVVCLDGVSFETTDSTAGIKNYLYEAVKELSPKFIRFPGGCIIEGENYEQAYDWKNSVGAVTNGLNAGDDTVPAFTYLMDEDGTAKEVTTYGEAITRKPNINLWENNGSEYFQMDYGIGFYDYFLLCESMNATALPVVNCGLSCQGQAYPGAALAGRHGKKIEDYIRDALDLVEFARGGEETKWGKIRAQMGHPAPFDMHYLGIGNEQWNAGSANSNYYTTYYEKFLEAFGQAKKDNPALYGDIELIVGNHQQLEHCEGYTGANATGGVAKAAAKEYRERTGKISALGEYGIQDHHYYNSPVDFFLHTKMYDGYARTGADRYEVFVGEYSANNTFRYAGDFSNHYKINNWFSALSEAAMMTGFERNGDIVRLAAYAPMFASLNGNRHWGVDMMLFTNTEVVRTANWYTQMIFMQNAGTAKADASLAYADGVAGTYTLTGTRAATTADIDRLYYVASFDEASKDLIVKIVNASEDGIKLNISVEGGSPKGRAKLCDMAEEADFVCSREREVYVGEEIAGGFTDGRVMGYESLPYSVAVLRFRMN